MLLCGIASVLGDFVFPDFNMTQGIVFNYDAATSSCTNLEGTRIYGEYEGDSDKTYDSAPVVNQEVVNKYTSFTLETDKYDQGEGTISGQAGRDIGSTTAVFSHRDDFKPHKTSRCAGRIRLTASQMSSKGSIWYHIPLSVNKGFQTLFTFQVSDHSRECSIHKDPIFTTNLYKSCAVHGGDGFAFVIHRDPNRTETIGRNGRGLGYDGIRNSLAVEFDTWYNPDTNTTLTGVDLVMDHIAVHSRSTLANSAMESASLGQQRPHPIADGQVHLAKIAYLPYIAFEYLDNFTATPNLVQYLKDNSEGRRVGTLVVFVDQGVEDDVPLMAIPINLSVLLDLDQDQAYAGFTASTGLKWEKHDILSWIWCDNFPCDTVAFQGFDYHQGSMFSAAAHTPRNNPNMGYGGTGDPDGAPTKNMNPNTDPITADKQHFATGRHDGLLDDADLQVPPYTEIR